MSKKFEEKLKSIFVQLVKSGLDKEKINGEKISLFNLPPDRYDLRMDFGNVSIFIPRLKRYTIAFRLWTNAEFNNAYVSPVRKGGNYYAT